MSIDKRLISTGAAPAVCTADTLDIFGDSSCVALYGLNYDASDAGGNYNGTPSNVTFNAPGYIDYAASFGSNSKVQLPSGSPFNDSDTIKSISAWVKADTTSSRVYPFSIGSSTIEDDFFNFGWIPANNYILLFIRDGSSSNQASHSAPLTADTEWHHIVVQTTGSAVQIFIDGESKSVTSSYSGTGSSSSWISYPSYGGSVIGNIGANAALNPVYSNGKIDQVRFFNKALSSSEVTTLYGEVACEYTCTTDTNGFPASASSDLVAYYKLDNDATDETGSYNGTATNVTFDGGRYGSSASFNGSSSYISGLPTVQNTSGEFSISLWFNTTVNPSVQHTMLGGIKEQGSNDSVIALKMTSDGYSKLYVRGTDGTLHILADTVDATDGNWHHLVGTVNSSSAILYVDGSQVDTATISNTVTVDNLLIGAENNRATLNPTNYFNGKIDQVRLYDKALSSTEVSSLYEDEHQCYITVDSTDPFGDSSNIALYEFENNANDSTGSYNGTASNVTYSTDSIIGTYAGSFNGGSSYINFSDRVFNVPLNGTLSEFSISLWFNAASVPSSGNVEFLSWWQTGNQTYKDGFLGLTTLNSNSIRFGDDWQSAYTFSSTSEMVDRWYHLIAVKTSTNAYIYIDGQLESTKGSTLDWGFNNFLAIGRQHTAGEYFNGKLDQVRLFSKVLNGDEIWKLYAEGAKG